MHVRKGKNLKKTINFVNIYRPPKDVLEKYNEFINEFEQILITLKQITMKLLSLPILILTF